MSTVYRAEHRKLHRQVAVKMLRDDFGRPEEMLARFEREAKALAAMSHPHIVHLIDFGISDDTPYLVTELLHGRTLTSLMASGPVLPEHALHVTRQILVALTFAHEHGVVHRDLKPGNVFLQDLPHDSLHVSILDFGFAKFFAADDTRNGALVTRSGVAFGTPPYMAPEQLAPGEIDGRIDLYATGTLLFEMLGGRRPFEGSRDEVLKAKLTTDPPRLASLCPGLEVRQELESLLSRSLARRPGARFSTASEMQQALDALPAPVVNQKTRRRASARPRPSLETQPAGTITEPSVPVEEWTRWVRVAGASAALVLVAGIGLGTWFTLRPTPAATNQPNLAAAPPPAPPAVAKVKVERLPIPDPWSAEVPAVLEQSRQELAADHNLSRDTLQSLRTFAHDNPADPRPHLLAGHCYVQRKWFTAALDQYTRALEASPEGRGDPQMLVNLIMMSTRASTAARSVPMIERIYGAEALVAIDRALELPDVEAAGVDALTQLRDRLRSK